MNPLKIIKIYFYFVIVILAIAGSSYNDSIKSFYIENGEKAKNIAMDLKSIGNMKIGMANVSGINTKEIRSVVSESKIMLSDSVIIELKKDAKSGFARNGDSGVKVMDILLKSSDNEIDIKKIAFKIKGAEFSYIEDLYLKDDNGNIVNGEVVFEKFVFDNIYSKMEKYSRKTFEIYINLGEKLDSNKRISFDIEEASDMEIIINGEKKGIKTSYPINGPWFSIVGEKIKKAEEK